STATAAPSSTRSSRSNQAAATTKVSPKGFYNRRGDQYLGDGGIIRQPRDLEYSSAFATYPEVGKGFANSYGTVIDAYGRILARCG
ncbi:6376_t:CDS:1, partial [Acaulospora colombiana]